MHMFFLINAEKPQKYAVLKNFNGYYVQKKI